MPIDTQVQTKKSKAEHLRPYWFKKGQSGHPSGRPKGPALDAVIQATLYAVDPNDPLKRTKVQQVVDAMHTKACGGDVTAATWLAQRGFGNLPIPVDHRITTVTQLVAELSGEHTDADAEN